MTTIEFVCICNEYGIAPAIVAEDLTNAGITGINETTLRTWLESQY
jgi:hypothetical protein